MENRANKKFLIMNYVLASLALVFLYSFLSSFAWWFKLAGLGLVVFSQALATLLYFWRQDVFFRLVQTFSFVVFVLFYGFALLDFYDVFDRVSDPEALRDLINSTGIWGSLVFLGLQLLQVVLLPIPSVILDLVGLALFGSLKAFFLITIGVVTGSMISFMLGKLFGKRLAVWIAGEEDAEKYRKLIGRNGFSLLAVMFLLPFFPDDLLCILAGMTAISYGQFFLLMILTRPVSIAFVCFFGTGEIIPFHGWGLIVWIVLFALLITAFILLNIYRKQISKVFKTLLKRKKKRAAAKHKTKQAKKRVEL